MNWNLHFMRTPDKKQRANHGAWALDFYMAAAPVEPRIILSGPGINRIEKIDK